MFNGLRVDVDSYADAIQAFRQLENIPYYITNNNTVDWNKLSQDIGGCDERLLSYFQTLDNGNGTIRNQAASVNGLRAHLEQTGQMYTFAAVKAALFNTALNAGVMLLFSAAIQAVVKGIDNYIHANENAIKLADELKDKHASAAKELESHRKTADELADSYDRLSKGVKKENNQYVNESLSEEDYQTFLDISNRLAEAFPTLQSGLDEEGNAILSLGQNGKTAAEDLAELLKMEEDINNYKISQDVDSLFDGVKARAAEAREAAEKYKTVSEESKEPLRELGKMSDSDTAFSDGIIKLEGNTRSSAGIKYYNSLSDSLQTFYQSLEPEDRMDTGETLDPSKIIDMDSEGTFDVSVNTNLLPEHVKEQISNLQEAMKEHAEESISLIQDEINEASFESLSKQQDAESDWNSLRPALAATMKSKGSFQKLADGAFGEEIQDFAVHFVSSLDYSVQEEMGETDPSSWLTDHVILPLTQLSDADRQSVAAAYQQLLELNPADLAEQNQNAIDGMLRQIAEAMGKEGSEEDIAYYRLNLGFEVDEDYKAKYKEAVQNSVGQFKESQSNMEEIFTELGIDTSGEIDRWNKIAESADSAAEAKQKYMEARLGDIEPSSFSPETLSKAMKSLSSLQSLYQDFCRDTADGAGFTFNISDIENLRKEFGETCSSFDEFERLASSSSTTAEEMQDAFHRLATEFIIQGNALDGLSSDTREQIVSQLELQGIVNADSIITEEAAQVIGEAARQNLSLANAADEAYLSLFSEGEAGAAAQKAVYALAAAEIAYSNVGFSTEQKIEQLKRLAAAYGDTTSASH